jgi:predicted alpha/beta hydrolase family esterase
MITPFAPSHIKKEGVAMDDWIAQREDQARKFPREAILISFSVGALLQIVASHALLIRLVLKLASPTGVTFAAWQLYRAVSSRQFSSAEESVAVNPS